MPSQRAAFLQSCLAWMQHPVVRIVATAVFVWIVFQAIDPQKVAKVLLRTSPSWLVAAEAFTFAATGIQVFIWAMLLRSNGKHLRWTQMASLYLQGLYFSHVLPGTVCGDAYRLLRSAPVTGQADAISSILASRMTELVATLSIAIVALVTLPAWFNPLRPFAVAGVVIAVGVLFYLVFIGRLPHKLFSKYKNPLVQRVAQSAMEASHAFDSYRSKKGLLFWCIALGAANWILLLASFVCFGFAVGATVPWNLFAIGVPLSILTALIPFSFNGVGLREGILVSLLATHGIDLSQALAIAILIDVQLVPVIAIGAVCWLVEREDKRQIPAAS